MARAFTLTVVLSLLWIGMSGHFSTLLLSFGAASVLGVVYIALRKGIVDIEGTPYEIGFSILIYWPWLFIEIVKANIDVTKRILAPSLNISPTLFTLKSSQHSDLGKVLYANSITLTPGTVTVAIEGDEFLVHALSEDAAKDLEEGTMDRKVSAAEHERKNAKIARGDA
ncbi:MAG: Na+/H+ antiporter subunit E [Alphaproteobacteria bacterium]